MTETSAGPEHEGAAASKPSGEVGLESLSDASLVASGDAMLARLAKAAAQRPVPHLTVQERRRKGKQARAAVPRSELAPWRAPAERADPVDLITGQETSRVQDLLPVRHARMATSAFAFYRGTALLMATDLAGCPRSGLQVQLCGDAHLSNFGLFAAPDRSLVFDVNDFDETHPGPFEWDVKRLATSFVLAARDNGLPEKQGVAAARLAVSTYRKAMADFALRPEIDIWYARIDVDNLVDWVTQSAGGGRKLTSKRMAEAQAAIAKVTAKARTRDAWSAIAKLTEVVDGQRQFRHAPPLLARIATDDASKEVLTSLFREYRATLQEDRQELLKRYQIIDFGHKVVGVGSVGLLAFVLLLRGRDDDDLMVLQVKQAQASVLEAFTKKSAYAKHGHRVAAGQRLMQAASDSFLGWIDGPHGRSFYVRQLRDMKWAPDPATLVGSKLSNYAELCGTTLARAHARSGDAIALAAYMGSGTSFDEAVTDFAVAYADQAQQDYAAFTAAIADGRLQAHEDAEGAESVQAVRSIGKAYKAGSTPGQGKRTKG